MVRDSPGQPSRLLGSEAETLVALLPLAAWPGLHEHVLLMLGGQGRCCLKVQDHGQSVLYEASGSKGSLHF